MHGGNKGANPPEGLESGPIGRRAGANLDCVVASWERELGSFCHLVDARPFRRTLFLAGMEGLGSVTLGYEVARRALATLYTFIYDFEVNVRSDLPACELVLANGSIRCISGMSKAPDLLAGDLVRERMEVLGILELHVVVFGDGAPAKVRMAGIVGSTTWNAIPPVLNFVGFKEGESFRAVELMRMIAVSINA